MNIYVKYAYLHNEHINKSFLPKSNANAAWSILFFMLSVVTFLQMMVRFHFSHETVACSDFLQDQLEILNSGVDTIAIGLTKFKELGKVW